ncbi:MAG TPA: YkgJ family cysteine cluster protein [Methanoculleus sp.]|nr:YkgJ family cysteine cluster protein [Methanoculleus sp.]
MQSAVISPDRAPVDPESALAARIKAIGFRCRQCGECCRAVARESNLVMVGPTEIRRICGATGRKWREIAEPYPEFLEDGQGTRFTFGWCLTRTADRCMFLEHGRCTIYDHRPWICRTYPFMLGEEGLMVFECPGLGGNIADTEARALAHALLARKRAEDEEYAAIKAHFATMRPSGSRTLVIDSEGHTTIHG